MKQIRVSSSLFIRIEHKYKTVGNNDESSNDHLYWNLKALFPDFFLLEQYFIFKAGLEHQNEINYYEKREPSIISNDTKNKVVYVRNYKLQSVKTVKQQNQRPDMCT